MSDELIAVVEAATALMAERAPGFGPKERDLWLAIEQLPPDWKEHVGWAEVTSTTDDNKTMIHAPHVVSIISWTYPDERTKCLITCLGSQHFHVTDTYEDVKRRLAL